MASIFAYCAVIFGGLLVLRLVYPPFMARWLLCWTITLGVEVVGYCLALALKPFLGQMVREWEDRCLASTT